MTPIMTPLLKTIALLTAAKVPLELIGVEAIQWWLARGETPEEIARKAGAKPWKAKES